MRSKPLFADWAFCLKSPEFAPSHRWPDLPNDLSASGDDQVQREFEQQLALAVDGGLAELPQTRWDWPY